MAVTINGSTGITTPAETATTGTFTDNLTLGGNQVLTTVNGGLGYGQTWTNFTIPSGRTFNTTYTNSTGKPILVHIMFQGDFNNGTFYSINASVNGVNLQFGAGAYTGSNLAGIGNASFIVPNGNTYQLTTPNSSILRQWVELR